jgi:transposase
MSVKGVEMVSIHEDMIDGDTYLKVLEEKVLPMMNLWPGDKSVLFSDNAPVHNKAAIMTLCQLHKVIAVFFEPYSYDYNPIELVFHSAKHFCRNRWPTDDPRSPISMKFEYALMNCIDDETACNYFAHCARRKISCKRKAVDKLFSTN